MFLIMTYIEEMKLPEYLQVRLSNVGWDTPQLNPSPMTALKHLFHRKLFQVSPHLTECSNIMDLMNIFLKHLNKTS